MEKGLCIIALAILGLIFAFIFRLSIVMGVKAKILNRLSAFGSVLLIVLLIAVLLG